MGAATSVVNALGSATLSQYGSFTYDGVFNVTGLTASVPGAATQSGSTTYGYDSKDRLTGETSTRLGGYSQSHAYDAAGNPTTLRGVAQSFDSDNRQTGGTSFAYDGNGSPTTYRGSSMAYDPEAGATAMGGLTAGYRADRLRAWKSYRGPKTYFLYDGGEPVAEMDVYGNVTATNVFAPDGLVARGTSSGWTQYAFDPEGNVAQRLSATGGVLTSSTYDGYGNGSTLGTAVDCFAYHAKQGYLLDETGLYCCQHRYYDAGTGRWVTRDPIGANGGVNVYGYCASGPVGRIDSSGLLGTSLDAAPGTLTADEAPEAYAGLARQGAAASSLGRWLMAPVRWIAGILGLGASATAVDPELPEQLEEAGCDAGSGLTAVIGQNMDRVRDAAQHYGGETYAGDPSFNPANPGASWGDNAAKLQGWVDRGYRLIDIGWDLARERGGSYEKEDEMLEGLGNPWRLPTFWPSSAPSNLPAQPPGGPMGGSGLH